MIQMVTRCPTCATAFRVTSTQLESAKGSVRCGSCLHIFKAHDYLVKAADEDKTVAPSVPKPIQAKAEASKPVQLNFEQPKPVAAKVVQPKVESKVEPKKESAVVHQSKPEQLKPKASAEAVKTPQPKVEQSIAKQPVAATPTAKPAAQPTSVKVQSTKPAQVHKPLEKKTPTAKPVIDKAKILADEDDILISDDMDRANEKQTGYEFDGFIDLNMHPKQTVSLFEREIRYEHPREDDDEEATDESWAEGLLDDDGEPVHQFKKPVVIVSPTPATRVEIQTPAKTGSTKDYSDNKYSGPVFSLISESSSENNENEKDEPFFSEAFLSATRAPEPTNSPSHFAAALFEQDDHDEVDEAEKSSKRPVKSASKMRAFDTSRAALLMNIMPAPVEFTARRMRRWYQKKLWPSLAIFMSILFFLQIAYFKFDYFSRVEPYRTAYLFLCPILGCEVPALVDTSKILATNLIVRNHPDTANALMVDAILINNAPFEQPFPDLILSFSKLDETPVASRRFTPKEYIGGELAGMKYIPQRQPVHITLEISDPGPDAVNYSLATH